MPGFVVIALCAMPRMGLAQQPPVDGGQLARVRALLQSSRPELSPAQYALLNSRLTEAEQAYAELVAVTEAGAGAATAAEIAGAIIGGAAELLPLLIAFWPATAHAPGMKDEKPKVRAARAKLDDKLKELSQAASQVDAERKPRKKCFCLCIADNLLQGSDKLENEAECRKFCPNRWPGTKGKCK